VSAEEAAHIDALSIAHIVMEGKTHEAMCRPIARQAEAPPRPVFGAAPPNIKTCTVWTQRKVPSTMQEEHYTPELSGMQIKVRYLEKQVDPGGESQVDMYNYLCGTTMQDCPQRAWKFSWPCPFKNT